MANGSNNEKIENQLNLALDLPEQLREKTDNLNIGYTPATNTWELIVKYSGNLDRIRTELNISITELKNEYAIMIIPQYLVERLADYEEIQYIEKPKALYFEVNEGRAVSCINSVQTSSIYGLLGREVLVAIIDSGIDYSHPDFRKENGTTRIAAIWDQTIPGNPPSGYDFGTIYPMEQINEALSVPMPRRLEIVPSIDISGHGTHVAGIAAGNGRASKGLYRGVAPESELLIIKLGTSIGNSFPKTTQLMTGIDFAVSYAIARNMPIAINISFGNNYGSHTGSTLLESYINEIANQGKTSIVIGTGNEGASGNHTQGLIQMGEVTSIELAVADFEFSTNVQIWKNYYDHFDITIISPNGTKVGPIPRILGTQQFRVEQTLILLYYGDPTPYNQQQEIYIEFVPVNNFINSGYWTFEFVPRKIVTGNFDMWLPTGSAKNPETRFPAPSEQTTLTIPSTAYRAISVSAYNGFTDSLAPFSGRGFTRNNMIKPDLAAPGVDITSCSPGGGYTSRSGTSMATPFVTGSAALLMEWGIINTNDPFLYGEKLKSYLINGCRPLKIENLYPNRTLGFGALCLRNSLDNIIL